MSSNLTGLFLKLEWKDFKGPVPASNPNNMSAMTASDFAPTGVATESVGSGATQSWRLGNNVTVTIKFDSSISWVLPSVASLNDTQKASLLNHEQGHYNITALLARDMFIELMQLKGVRLSSSSVVVDQAKAIFARYQKIAQPLQDLYDSSSQTNHGKDNAKQLLWDGYINTAFTKARVPAVQAPDGKLYKEELLSILRTNKIPI